MNVKMLIVVDPDAVAAAGNALRRKNITEERACTAMNNDTSKTLSSSASVRST